MIAASLNGILAQRLVRRLCSHCKEPFTPPDNLRKYMEMGQIEPHELMMGKGCDQCRNSGYAGRCGIHELLIVDDTFREIINSDSSVNSMRAGISRERLALSVRRRPDQGQRGVTSIEEVLRVTKRKALIPRRSVTTPARAASSKGQATGTTGITGRIRRTLMIEVKDMLAKAIESGASDRHINCRNGRR